MPDFSASLSNPTGPDTTESGDGTTVSFVDFSNYSTNTDPGHATAQFSNYRKIFVMDSNNVTVVYSSLGDGDILIGAANSGDPYFDFTVGEAGDGVYSIRLITLPTWGGGYTYASIGDTVYYSGKIYQSKITNNTNHQPDTSPTQWLLITNEILVNTKYNVLLYFSRTYDIQVASDKMGASATGKFTGSRQPDLVKNDSFLLSIQYLMLLASVKAKMLNGEYDTAESLITVGKNYSNC